MQYQLDSFQKNRTKRITKEVMIQLEIKLLICQIRAIGIKNELERILTF